MVIGAPDVDEVIVAPGELVLVIGDVGREVRGPFIAADQYPILVVPVGSGAQPHRVVQAVGVSALEHPVDGALHMPFSMQRGLAEPAIERHPETFELRAHLVQYELIAAHSQRLYGRRRGVIQALRAKRLHPLITDLFADLGGDLD